MTTERKEDLITVEADSYIEKLIEKYYRAKLGDRIGEVENGEIYSQEGRRPAKVSEEIRSIDQRTISG